MKKAAALVCMLSMVLVFVPQAMAGAAGLQVYKGELRILLPGSQPGSVLQVQYRSKTRDVVRIAVNQLLLTHVASKEIIRLPAQTAGLTNRIDDQGYWVTDILYDDISLAEGNYRVEGRLTQYLVGSQRTRNFSVYLEPAAGTRPEGSSIDWGVDN